MKLDFLNKIDLSKITGILNKIDDDSHEFLPIISEIEQSPMNPLGRTIFWIILVLIFFTLLWMFFGKVDVVVTTRGKIIPDGEIKIIQPLETGVIKEIRVKEGDFVKKGQILIEIDSSTTQPELESLKKNLEYTNIENERINALVDGRGFSTEDKTQKRLYESALADLKNQIKAKNAEISQINSQISSAASEQRNYKHLLSMNEDKERRMINVSDIIAYSEIEKVKSENIGYQTQIQTLNHKIDELQHRKNQTSQEINHIKSNFKTQYLTQLTEKELKAIGLESNIETIEFRNTQQTIVSPVDGYINTLLVHTIGGVVTPAKEILSIVPADSPLVAKVRVLNKDIGYIKEGMSVQIKIDTYEFQKYGMIKGTVKKVTKDSIEDEKEGLVYDIYITPLEKTLMVDGKELDISTGMSLSAEIKVDKRRIIEFFIYPIVKYWSEAVSIK